MESLLLEDTRNLEMNIKQLTRPVPADFGLYMTIIFVLIHKHMMRKSGVSIVLTLRTLFIWNVS
jgi:hypothetical protein